MPAEKSNVIRLYDVRPEMALEHLKRSTGLDFNQMPQNLVTAKAVDRDNESAQVTPPVLTDIVEQA